MAKKEKAPTIAEVIRTRRSNYLIAQGYRSLGLRCIALAVILFILFTQVFLITQVNGNQMFPAVKDGDLVFAYRLQDSYSKNDVVVFSYGGETRVGRIIGREGDVINIDDSGSLRVNGAMQGGEIMYPTYAKEGYEYPYVVPQGSFFILCDYRTQCEDSRDFGPIKEAAVEGKVITILRRRAI